MRGHTKAMEGHSPEFPAHVPALLLRLGPAAEEQRPRPPRELRGGATAAALAHVAVAPLVCDRILRDDGVTENILGGVCVGVGIVVVHGVMREADEDDGDEEMEGEEDYGKVCKILHSQFALANGELDLSLTAEEDTEVAIRRNRTNKQLPSRLLFHHSSFLLHQHRRRDALISTAAAGDEGHQRRLNGAQAGVEGGGLHAQEGEPIVTRLQEQRGVVWEEVAGAESEEVGDEELLGVDGVVEGEAGELEVDADEDAAGGAHADGGDGEAGDGRAGEGKGGVDEGVEEAGEGEAGGFRHGFGRRRFDYEWWGGKLGLRLRLIHYCTEFGLEI
ncbi:putative inactive cytidine deaminase 4 [Senna tora]|uniref:Putative inactive cytidine deaminase 4 n=1 Tax=Senna tora TaxID=362788 RepID=A0A834WH15_9FABA|nr:putative inactive cytidine deaminase 4 [Senna tora]